MFLFISLLYILNNTKLCLETIIDSTVATKKRRGRETNVILEHPYYLRLRLNATGRFILQILFGKSHNRTARKRYKFLITLHAIRKKRQFKKRDI